MTLFSYKSENQNPTLTLNPGQVTKAGENIGDFGEDGLEDAVADYVVGDGGQWVKDRVVWLVEQPPGAEPEVAQHRVHHHRQRQQDEGDGHQVDVDHSPPLGVDQTSLASYRVLAKMAVKVVSHIPGLSYIII